MKNHCLLSSLKSDLLLSALSQFDLSTNLLKLFTALLLVHLFDWTSF